MKKLFFVAISATLLCVLVWRLWTTSDTPPEPTTTTADTLTPAPRNAPRQHVAPSYRTVRFPEQNPNKPMQGLLVDVPSDWTRTAPMSPRDVHLDGHEVHRLVKSNANIGVAIVPREGMAPFQFAELEQKRLLSEREDSTAERLDAQGMEAHYTVRDAAQHKEFQGIVKAFPEKSMVFVVIRITRPLETSDDDTLDEIEKIVQSVRVSD